MADITVLYWRDIPAEILVREGRARTRAELGARFAEAIDLAAMRSGARDSGAYLDGWRRGAPTVATGDPASLAEAAARDIEAAYPPERLAALVGQEGWTMPKADAGGGRRLETSIEATPKQALTAEELKGLLPAGTRVYLTDLGSDDEAALVGAARRLRDLGYEPVPHIAVRRLTGRAAAARRLERLAGEAGVRDVLVIGGGVARPAGPYGASIDFLEDGVLDACGIDRVGIAGHPEGSPDIAEAAIEAALRQKLAYARRTGATLRIVTQFGFDPKSATRWIAGLAAAGYDIPVHLGIAGPARVSTLLRYAAMCGVGPSLGFLRQRAGHLATLTTSYTPEAFVAPVEAWHEGAERSLLAGLHVFPFGGLGPAGKWLIGRGSVAMPAGSGRGLARKGGIS